MPQLNVSLPDGLKAWTDARVAEDRFSSPSDYVRDLIRRDQDAATELQWLQGEITPSHLPAPDVSQTGQSRGR